MKTPQVSVIVPSFNYGHLIHETLQSLLDQDFQDWECIIVDNESTDDTRSIVTEYCDKDERFRYVEIAHTTTSAVRNRGLAECRSEFVLFLDSDDQVGPRKLGGAMELFAAHPECDIVFSGTDFYDHGNPGVYRKTYTNTRILLLQNYVGHSHALLADMLKKNLFVISSPITRIQAIRNIHGFREELNWVEDWDFYIRLFISGLEIRCDEDVNSTSRIRVHQRSLSRNTSRMLEQSYEVRSGFMHFVHQGNLPNSKELEEINRTETRYLLKLLYHEYRSERPDLARKYLLKYIREYKDYKMLKNLVLSYFKPEILKNIELIEVQ